MRWLAFALVLASCTAAPLPSATTTATPTATTGAVAAPAQTPTPSPLRTAEYVDSDFGVRLAYPAEWSFVYGYGAPRFEGASGFVMLDAALAPSVEEVCRNAATHTFEPYGSKPRIETLTVDGRDACVVLPSADQPIQRFRSAELAVLAPRLVYGQYPVLVVHVDLDHVMEIARSLKFVAP